MSVRMCEFKIITYFAKYFLTYAEKSIPIAICFATITSEFNIIISEFLVCTISKLLDRITLRLENIPK